MTKFGIFMDDLWVAIVTSKITFWFMAFLALMQISIIIGKNGDWSNWVHLASDLISMGLIIHYRKIYKK